MKAPTIDKFKGVVMAWQCGPVSVLINTNEMVGTSGEADNIRQFIESAIREKLERAAAGKGAG